MALANDEFDDSETALLFLVDTNWLVIFRFLLMFVRRLKRGKYAIFSFVFCAGQLNVSCFTGH